MHVLYVFFLENTIFQIATPCAVLILLNQTFMDITCDSPHNSGILEL